MYSSAVQHYTGGIQQDCSIAEHCNRCNKQQTQLMTRMLGLQAGGHKLEPRADGGGGVHVRGW